MSRPTQDTCSASTTCPISQTGCRTRSASSPKAAATVSAPLYTDKDESLLFACAPLFLTGVTNIIVRGDLMQRTMFADLTPVHNDERVADEDF